jgi:hypothetical protein
MTEQKININCKSCGKQLTTRTQSISLPNLCSDCWKKRKENDINNYQNTREYEDYLCDMQRDHENWRNYDFGCD